MAISAERLLNLGDDATANQWSAIFPEGIPGGGDTETISLRMDTTFDPPEEAVNTYDIFHKGYKYSKTGTLQETTKEFTLEIRIDQQWKIYKDLRSWADKVYDHHNGTGLPDAQARTTIIIQAEDRQQKGVFRFKFLGVKPKSNKIGTFDNANGEPIRLTMQFVYIDMVPESA